MTGRPSVRMKGIERPLAPPEPTRPHGRAAMSLAPPGANLPDPPPRASLRDACPPASCQNPLSACTPFAFTTALRFLDLQDGREDARLSPLFCYWVARVLIEGQEPELDAGCRAASVVAALEGHGACLESLWPYDPTRFAERPPQAAFDDAATRRGIRGIPLTTLRAIKLSIAEGFPVVFMYGVAASVHEPDGDIVASVWDSGVFPVPTPRAADAPPIDDGRASRAGERLGGSAIPSAEPDYEKGRHTVLAVGYDDATQLVTFLNTWGPDFGQSGFGALPFAFFGPDQDTCIQTSSCSAGDAWTLRPDAPAGATPPGPSDAHALLLATTTRAVTLLLGLNLRGRGSRT